MWQVSGAGLLSSSQQQQQQQQHSALHVARNPFTHTVRPTHPPCTFTCRFMAYDRHMNLVLGDAEEFRKLPPKKGSKEEVRQQQQERQQQRYQCPAADTVEG